MKSWVLQLPLVWGLCKPFLSPVYQRLLTSHSVVFASAYRTSVLFTYSATDPSYTLAPTVGWTAIEMSAGIVSACLPTLLPVARVIGKYTGLSRLLGSAYSTTASIFTRGETGAGKSRRSRDAKGSQVSDSHMNPRSKAFYRLSDKTDSDGLSDGSVAAPVDAKLRPDTKGYVSTVTSYKAGDEERDEGDAILLQGIHVHKDFTRSTIQAD